jgi:tRNA nucleotidyltransferase/poly(A) polymerase
MNTQTIKNRIQNDEILNNLASFFDNDIWLVGGAVRDILLNNEITDRDLIVTDCDAKIFSMKVAEFFDAKFIPLDEENKIYRVVLNDKKNYLDITNPIGNSLEKDICRRDLSVNAIAVNIKSGEFFDPTNGLKDFENKALKGINEANFTDDPLRLLRIFRFHSTLGFEISQDLMNITKKHAAIINKPAKERIEYELMKLFDGKYADCALLKMDECGILELIFPFVNELKRVPPNAHHHLDLFHHSIETVKQIQILYENSADTVKEHLQKIDFGGFSRLAHLKLAAFMHDIGKFSTWFIEKDTGRHRFYKHDDVGSKMAPEILRNLAFSNKQIKYIQKMIKNHMYATMVVCSPELSDKIMMRYVRKMEDDSIDAIIIGKADRLSALGPEITQQMVEENLTMLDKLLNFYIDSLETIKPLPKLLDGNEIMELLEIKPSPQLGKILNELHEGQLNGDITTKQQAVEFVKKLYER